jgi:putative tryptophan/tyrosine transport system substrate-binding protein
MNRRWFMALIGGAAAAWPLAARAQQPERMRRIVLLLPMAEDNPVGLVRISALVKELQQLGWAVGRNIGVDVRWAGANAESIRKHAMELVELAPDVILAQGSVTVTALLQATRSVSIIFPSPSMCSLNRMPGPAFASIISSVALRFSSGSGRRSSPFSSIRSKA